MQPLTDRSRILNDRMGQEKALPLLQKRGQVSTRLIKDSVTRSLTTNPGDLTYLVRMGGLKDEKFGAVQASMDTVDRIGNKR